MSDSWRTRLGILLILLGVAGIIVSFGPLQFGDRLSGRVEAEGTVQWGVYVDATSPGDTVADGEYGAWKVDYEIDGSAHTGVIVGAYFEGQQIIVSAPADGSIYAILREGTSTGLKILSWFVLPLSLALAAVGSWWLVRGLRAADARNREVARQQLARLYPQLFPPAPLDPTSLDPTSLGPAALGPAPFGPAPFGPASFGDAPNTAAPNAHLRGPAGPAGPPSMPPAAPSDDDHRRGKSPDFFAPYDI